MINRPIPRAVPLAKKQKRRRKKLKSSRTSPQKNRIGFPQILLVYWRVSSPVHGRWPSFFDLVKEESITRTDDFSYGMHRVETTCSQCGAHLGHLFDDGPRPTGKRYCINSASLTFQPKNTAPSTSSSAAEGGAASSSVSDGKTEF